MENSKEYKKQVKNEKIYKTSIKRFLEQIIQNASLNDLYKQFRRNNYNQNRFSDKRNMDTSV